MDLKDIRAIIDLMKKNSVSEFELEKQDFKIKLKRSQGEGIVYQATTNADPMMTPHQLPPPGVGIPAAGGAPPVSDETEIKSPMIGTFYRAPSPEAEPYVELGSEVNPETVVCIIEAMKVMNEIKAECNGVVTQSLWENSKPVEFGQPLFRIKPH
ncbi:MAG TPA: acetyl-CoA carboxylase biotin carboxyl carrier protein [Verrucomicrobia bacterium]|nr:acetyl-CoA carboxylase biotin carboxyl carrier protein [Verrucomicrobiota bacterium]